MYYICILYYMYICNNCYHQPPAKMERQRFLCELCGACYTYNIYNKDLRKHCRDKHEGSRYYQCNVCRRVFTTLSNLRRHTLEVHSTDNFPCDLCNASFKSVRYLKDHKFAAHVARADPPPMSPSQHDIVSEPAASPMPGPSRMTVSPIAGPSHKIVEEFDEDIW
ncbi:myoneurin-like isoform X2 [Periplaneta americana]|uniref:myoneurin-like isoform X2 n=1 Tax=Periplaneta americana TaxID=6978 RepID=UPI0037E8DA4B